MTYNPKYKDIYERAQKKWLEKNPNAMREAVRRHYLENKERILAYKKEYYQKKKLEKLEAVEKIDSLLDR